MKSSPNCASTVGTTAPAKSAAVIADLDGGVRAMVGGRDYGASQFNRATDALRQPGSSFKPYVYATALANGFTPSSVVVDSPVCIGNWCPHNYSGGYSGPVTLLEAITHSINVIPVKLSIMLGKGNPKLGRAMIVQTARNFGITFAAAGYAVAADRRRRSLRYRARRRLCHLPQSRPRGRAACGAGSPHRFRPVGVALRPRRTETETGDQSAKSR